MCMITRKRISNTHLAEMISGVSKQIKDLKQVVKDNHEFLSQRAFPEAHDREDLEGRVLYIERKLKIRSGKRI